MPSAPPIPSARVVGTHVPTARAGPVTRQSFLAVVIESSILVEDLGNRARPHLHQAHPMVTAERPARRHDGRWHLYIFGFLLHWIKSWKQGVQTLSKPEHNSPYCAHCWWVWGCWSVWFTSLPKPFVRKKLSVLLLLDSAASCVDRLGW